MKPHQGMTTNPSGLSKDHWSAYPYHPEQSSWATLMLITHGGHHANDQHEQTTWFNGLKKTSSTSSMNPISLHTPHDQQEPNLFSTWDSQHLTWTNMSSTGL